MIEIGKVFFCESVSYYPDGSPREFINQISSVKMQVYPDFFQCNVVVNIIHSEPLDNLLSIRMRENDSYLTIFESAPISLSSNAPTEPNTEMGMIVPIETDIPEPGDYTIEILLDSDVKHKEQLSFT